MEIKVKYPTKDNFTKFGTIVVPSFKESPATFSENHNYWHNVADISQLGEEGTVGFLEIKRKEREFVLDKMERHQYASESFIPTSFFLAPGVWHWLPFALTPEMKFVLLLKKSTVEKDLEIVDLPEKVKIVLIK